MEIINDLYQNELRLYKNFFWPGIKLSSKERIRGKIYRRYHFPKTSYQRMLEAEEVSVKKKEDLRRIYESLNPVELEKAVDRKLDLLWKVYQNKNKSQKAGPQKKIIPISLTFYIQQTKAISLTYLNPLTQRC